MEPNSSHAARFGSPTRDQVTCLPIWQQMFDRLPSRPPDKSAFRPQFVISNSSWKAGELLCQLGLAATNRLAGVQTCWTRSNRVISRQAGPDVAQPSLELLCRSRFEIGGGLSFSVIFKKFKNSPWYLTYSPANDERKIN